MEFSTELTLIKQKIRMAEETIDALIQSARSPSKFNTLIDSAMKNMKTVCIELWRITEIIRPHEKSMLSSDRSATTIYGGINITDEGWLHIKLNTLLPHYKIIGLLFTQTLLPNA